MNQLYVQTKRNILDEKSEKSDKSLYIQIKDIIFGRIEQGEYKAGEKIPTEEELQQEFSVSRATVRHALDEIAREGLIYRKKGLGTTVRHKRIKPDLLKLTGFSQVMKARGIKPSFKTLKVEIIDAPLEIKRIFGDDHIHKIWFVKRICLGDDKIFAMHELYLHPQLEFSPNELYEMKSFYGLVAQKHKLVPAYADETLGAAVADNDMARQLQIEEGDPLLDIWRTTYAENGQIIEVVRIIYIADRFEYQLRLYP